MNGLTDQENLASALVAAPSRAIRGFESRWSPHGKIIEVQSFSGNLTVMKMRSWPHQLMMTWLSERYSTTSE
jgi:hypothetical protein